ncbi:MAG TPA: hypothetical protein VMI94_10545 [Bryobacteraceae bacterium]|nr:hypothetical protein [Bryobacteraceae bacterium]
MPHAKPGSRNHRFNRIDYLISELLDEAEPNGEKRLRKDLRKRYHPVEPMEEVLVDCLAILAWRLHGCTMLESQSLADTVFGDLRDSEVLSKLRAYKASLSGHADNCRHQLDRFAQLRKRAAAEAAARFKKLKPCTSVIQ